MGNAIPGGWERARVYNIVGDAHADGDAGAVVCDRFYWSHVRTLND